MPIFRVHGVNLQGESSTVDIQCESEAVARNLATRNGGLVNTTRVDLIDEKDVDQSGVLRPKPARIKPKVVVGGLSSHPILTIAAGVFLGLFAWTLFMIVLSLILGVTASFTP